MAIWSDLRSGGRKNRLQVRCGSRVGSHLGSQMAAKLEPNGVNMAIEIVSKVKLVFDKHF